MLVTKGRTDCTLALEPVDTPGKHIPAANDLEDEVRLYTAPSTADPLDIPNFQQVAQDPTDGASLISKGTNAASTGDPGTILDHPRMAANPASPDQVVVTYLSGTDADRFVTLRRTAGTWSLAKARDSLPPTPLPRAPRRAAARPPGAPAGPCRLPRWGETTLQPAATQRGRRGGDDAP
jgi:hypothetical protein